MRKVLFIYNPRAGKGQVRNSLSYILEELSLHKMMIVVHPTSRSRDAAEHVQKHGQEYDLIICSGGDGTLDEVVTGMMRGNFSVPIGYIPAGSTNDFANSIGIPRQMRSAAASIAEGDVYSLDVGRLGEGYFIYVAAFGAFTEVSYKTPQETKNVLGHLAYLIEGLKSLPTIKSWDIAYTSEECSGSGRFIYGMITNSNSVGGFKGITGKDVTLNDGVFEVTLIREPGNILEWPVIAAALLNGDANENIISFKTAKIEMSCQEAVPWTTDGEYGGEYDTVVVENMQRALKMVLGRQPDQILSESETSEDGEI